MSLTRSDHRLFFFVILTRTELQKLDTVFVRVLARVNHCTTQLYCADRQPASAKSCHLELEAIGCFTGRLKMKEQMPGVQNA